MPFLLPAIGAIIGAVGGASGAGKHNKEADKHNRRAKRLSGWAGLFDIDRQDLQEVRKKDAFAEAMQGALSGGLQAYTLAGGLGNIANWAGKTSMGKNALGMFGLEDKLFGGQMATGQSGVPLQTPEQMGDMSGYGAAPTVEGNLNKYLESQKPQVQQLGTQLQIPELVGDTRGYEYQPNMLEKAQNLAQNPVAQTVAGVAAAGLAPQAALTGAAGYGAYKAAPYAADLVGKGIDYIEGLPNVLFPRQAQDPTTTSLSPQDFMAFKKALGKRDPYLDESWPKTPTPGGYQPFTIDGSR